MWVSALGPTVFDLVEDRVEILLATHPLDHPGPEGAVAHLARHLVGGVEPEDVGAIDQISDRRQRLVGVQALVECNVRGDPSAGLSRIGAELGRCDRLEHLRRSLVLRVEHGHEVASTEDRLTLIATLVRRQDEHFGVRGEVGLDVIGEEGRDEVALPVQEAARRVGPQTVVSHVEGVRGDGLLAAVHGAIHEQKLGDGLAGLLHDRVVERDLVADPLVVDLRTTDAEDVLLHPVRARPADVDTEAPGSGAVSLDLVGQRHELLVGCGRDVAGVLELGRRIPHEALAVDRVREAVHDVVHRGGVDDSRHSGVDVAAAPDAAVPGIIDTAPVDDVVYGLPYSINGKSLVWYPSPEFEDAGYVPATTHQELVALSDQIKADGTAPWCFGVDVGWPGTDWMEEYVLRVGGPEVYDQWVSHEIPFNDPIVKQAGEAVAELLLVDGAVYGGKQAITANTFDVADDGLWTDPPSCFLHRQGNFITSFFPDDVQADLAANTKMFILPPYEGGYEGQPILGGGDFMAMFDTKNEAAAQVLEAIASAEFGADSAQTGAWISPYVAFDKSLYANETLAAVADLIYGADVFRFDASDQMPGEVGNGTFWTGMVEWMGGQKDLDTVLNEIENSWPKS